MNKSESIGALALALSKLQGEVQNVYKDKAGFGYKYTELCSILEVTRPLCAKYELVVTQLCTSSANDVGVETVLAHSSGEWISSTVLMPVTPTKGMSPAQATGCIITYARRYSLAAILGIAQTDDDASPQGAHVDESAKPAASEPSVYYQIFVKHIQDNNLTKADCQQWLDDYSVDRLSKLSEFQLRRILRDLGVKV